MPIRVEYDESTQTELEWNRQRNIVRIGNRFWTLGELFGRLGLTEEDCRIALKEADGWQELWGKYPDITTQIWRMDEALERTSGDF